MQKRWLEDFKHDESVKKSLALDISQILVFKGTVGFYDIHVHLIQR